MRFHRHPVLLVGGAVELQGGRMVWEMGMEVVRRGVAMMAGETGRRGRRERLLRDGTGVAEMAVTVVTVVTIVTVGRGNDGRRSSGPGNVDDRQGRPGREAGEGGDGVRLPPQMSRTIPPPLGLLRAAFLRT